MESEEDIEKVARAYREGIYGPITKETAWDNCKEHWIRDTKAFLKRLAELGFEVVEIKRPKVRTT
jgi:hypothetical protein